MKALVKVAAGPGLELTDVPDPTPGPTDVLVRVLRTGICGTDLHQVKGEFRRPTPQERGDFEGNPGDLPAFNRVTAGRAIPDGVLRDLNEAGFPLARTAGTPRRISRNESQPPVIPPSDPNSGGIHAIQPACTGLM